MSSLQAWLDKSEETRKHYPGMYLQDFPNMLVDDQTVVVTREDYDRLQLLPHYDGTQPTGVFNGKMWLRHDRLAFYEPDPNDDTMAVSRSREILVVE